MLTHSRYITKVSLFFVFLGTIVFLNGSPVQGTTFEVEAKKIEEQTNAVMGIAILSATIVLLPYSISSSIKLWNFYNQRE